MAVAIQFLRRSITLPDTGRQAKLCFSNQIHGGDPFQLAGDLVPPTERCPDAAAPSELDPPRRAALAYISDQSNATTAQCRTRDANQPINVTLYAAAPPRVSYLCVHCPCLDPANFATEPTVLAAEDRFVLLRVPIGPRTIQDLPMCNDYFIYQAGNSRSSSSSPPPSLLLLPNPGRISIPDNRTVFCIHKAISIGGRGGSMGWVDLWSGILVCDVLRKKNPVLRYTPFPVIRYRSDLDDQIIAPAASLKVGTATTWTGSKAGDSWEWNVECSLDVHGVMMMNDQNDVKLLTSSSEDDEDPVPVFGCLCIGAPAPSLENDGLVCFMAKVDIWDHEAWMLAVDTRNKVVQGVDEFRAERTWGLEQLQSFHFSIT
ncbi:hypothetical protein PR202_gb03117 [Eleusine coracana subsp. coracana]|uniref:DUF1618 domain-containing protein n=1 Tax=Eleusine coracana subsp. coracana TaxID=191504 RepID=A0AAV5E177_ELECO|nr:hypothetical protein PR202_gb03117 [Eleusine coracana subsp. coracana]